MGFDLGRVRSRREAERLEETIADRGPVGIRVRNGVRVEITHRPVELTADRDIREQLRLSFEAVHEVRDLLAERRGCSWLAVRPGEHRHVGESVCEGAQLDAELLHRR